jgi:hypothetical protein
MSMDEALINASCDLGFVCDELKDALNKSDCVSSILLLPRIGSANKLRREIKALRRAHRVDNERQQKGKKR